MYKYSAPFTQPERCPVLSTSRNQFHIATPHFQSWRNRNCSTREWEFGLQILLQQMVVLNSTPTTDHHGVTAQYCQLEVIQAIKINMYKYSAPFTQPERCPVLSTSRNQFHIATPHFQSWRSRNCSTMEWEFGLQILLQQVVVLNAAHRPLITMG